MLSSRLLEVGTASAHLDTLLLYWNTAERELADRIAEDSSPSEFSKNKLKELHYAAELLTRYIKDHVAGTEDSTEDTRYAHIASMYEEWIYALDQAKAFKSSSCKTLAEKLQGATTLAYTYLTEDTSDYELLKLVNSAKG
jgi:hypothetical protein